MRKESVSGRMLGIVIFLIGVGILLLVALLTYRLFNNSVCGTGTPIPAVGAAAHLGSSAVNMLYQVALLLVMCIAGSLLAARGIHFYYVASGREE